ncbi:MAG: hypothetical protein K940chlam7_01026 [Chlamydiae bacterium]|nr:hypothetical protein [Chlamydiota bacterium]
MYRPVADLHCDLLLYLAGEDHRSAYDLAARCSIPQMRAGHVVAQVLPVFSFTGPKSSQAGWTQVELFKKLPYLYPDSFEIIQKPVQLHARHRKDKIGIMLAFENASSFCDEEENLDNAFQRLSKVEEQWTKIIYISMTWNTENRFGGGTHTNAGIKEDGKRLLNFLHQRKIAVDLSHASDKLANDILNTITKHNLDIPVLASHSNFRSIKDHSRNLPDEISKEVISRGGVIGVNFIRPFVGDEENFVRQLEFGLNLGAENHLCFGADFFFEGDVDSPDQDSQGWFFSAYPDSGCYPVLLEQWRKKLGLTEKALDQISYSNVKKFIQTRILH